MNINKKVFGTFFFIVLFFTIMQGFAHSAPFFSKKFELSCTQCHNIWPQLNRFGHEFKRNGFQLKGMDLGDKVSKNKIDDNLFLDSGDANLPLSFRLELETSIKQKNNKIGEPEYSRRSFIGLNKESIVLITGGNLNSNVSWYTNWNPGSKPSTAYIGIHNIVMENMINVRAGILNLNDHSVVNSSYNSLSRGKIVNGGPVIVKTIGFLTESILASSGVGLELSGTLGENGISYSIGINDGGSNLDEVGGGDRERTLGGMLRWDKKDYSISYSYNEGKHDFRYNVDGGNESVKRDQEFALNYYDSRIANGKSFVGKTSMFITTFRQNFYSHNLSGKFDSKPFIARVWTGLSKSRISAPFVNGSSTNKNIGYGLDFGYYNSQIIISIGYDFFTTENIYDNAVESSYILPYKYFSSGVYKNGNSVKDNLDYSEFSSEVLFLLSANAKLGITYNYGGWEDNFLQTIGGYKDSKFSVKLDLVY